MGFRLFIIGLLCSVAVFGQSKKINNTSQLWTEVDFAGKLRSKFKLQLDLQYSSQSPYESLNLVRYNAKCVVRPWLHFYPSKNIRLSFFAGVWYNCYIRGMCREYIEYRTALQANFYRNREESILGNRFRLELRDIQNREGKFERVIRGRYMLKYTHLLKHHSFDKKSLYAFTSDEYFVNGGSKVTGFKFFDQNRFFVGLGYNLASNFTVETSYFNQFQQHARDNNYDMNHIMQLSFIIDNIRFMRPHHLHAGS